MPPSHRRVFFAEAAAASNVEYAVLLGTVAVVVIAGAIIAGQSFRGSVENANDRLTDDQAQSSQASSGGGATGSSGSSQSSTPVTKLLYSANFDDPNLVTGLTLSGGNWILKQGQLWAGSSGGINGEHRAFFDGTVAADSVISVDATLKKGDGYGVFFRASGDITNVNGYTFEYDAGDGVFVMKKWVNGVELVPFATAAPPSGFDWTGTQRNIEVTTNGSSFTAKIDGQVVLTGTDSSYASGQAGVRVWSGGHASFDNVKVSSVSR